MNKPFQILTILLAVLVFLSPVLSFASVLTLEEHSSETGCHSTDDSENADYDCCHSDQPLADKKSCADHSCPTHDCHLHHVTPFHIYFPEKTTENEIYLISSEKLKSDNYSSFPVKDMSFSFWNPPKYIS